MDTTKFSKLLALASSDNDAEALSALRMAKKMLKAEGLDFKDVASSVSPSRTEPAHAYDYEPPKPKGYSKGGFTWESREVYESYMANQARMREAERQRYAPARAAVLEKYGSAEAAIARNDREQILHEAALPWLEEPFQPNGGEPHLAGRWHRRIGGGAPTTSNASPPPNAAPPSRPPCQCRRRSAKHGKRPFIGRLATMRFAMRWSAGTMSS